MKPMISFGIGFFLLVVAGGSVTGTESNIAQCVIIGLIGTVMMIPFVREELKDV